MGFLETMKDTNQYAGKMTSVAFTSSTSEHKNSHYFKIGTMESSEMKMDDVT
jgi:hypothetical protein